MSSIQPPITLRAVSQLSAPHSLDGCGLQDQLGKYLFKLSSLRHILSNPFQSVDLHSQLIKLPFVVRGVEGAVFVKD